MPTSHGIKMTVERIAIFLAKVKSSYWLKLIPLAILLVVFVWLGNSKEVIIATMGGIIVGIMFGQQAFASLILKRIRQVEKDNG